MSSSAGERRRKLTIWTVAFAGAMVFLFAWYRVDSGLAKVGEQRNMEYSQSPIGAEDDKATPAEPAAGSVEAIGDLDLPPKRPPPVHAEDDRGAETLLIGSARCLKLDKSFQATVSGEGKCEVYLHDLSRQGDTIIIMASPQYGVRANGRPIMTILPGSAYPRR